MGQNRSHLRLRFPVSLQPGLSARLFGVVWCSAHRLLGDPSGRVGEKSSFVLVKVDAA